MAQKKTATICIFMATYNGAQYIRQQLESFESQTIRDWELVISDDGSTDETLQIIQNFKEKHPLHSISILNGPKKGFASNFLSMLEKYNGDALFFAFSDQDDVWENNKIENALKKLKTIPSNKPALYCGRTEYINQSGNRYTPAQYSRRFNHKPSFENSLVQCLAGGNTMVFNRRALELVISTQLNNKVPSHDWWIYQLISGCGGVVFYDPQPTVLYRQHNTNLIGGNKKFLAKARRLYMFLSGKFALSNRLNLANLLKNKEILEQSSIISLENYYQACNNNRFYLRVAFFFKSKAKRQSLLENLLLYLGVIFKKI